MAGISSKAALRSLSAYKYNAGSELEDEGGLNYYNTFYRKYDAQIGRFTGVDVQAESFAGLTPFQFGNNNPVFFNDPAGAKFVNIRGDAGVNGGLPGGGCDYGARMADDGFGDDAWYAATHQNQVWAQGDDGAEGGGGGGSNNFNMGNVGLNEDGDVVFACGGFAKALVAALQTALRQPNNDLLESYGVFSSDGTLLGSVDMLKNESYVGKDDSGDGIAGGSVSVGYTYISGPKNLDWIQMAKSDFAAQGHPANTFFIDGSTVEGHKNFPYTNTNEDMMAWLHAPETTEFRNTHYSTWFHDAPYRHWSDGNATWEAYLSLVDKDHGNAILIQFHYGFTNNVNNGNQNSYQPLQQVTAPMPLPWMLTFGIILFP